METLLAYVSISFNLLCMNVIFFDRSERGSLANCVTKELERLKKKSTVAQGRLIEEETSAEGNVIYLQLRLFLSVRNKKNAHAYMLPAGPVAFKVRLSEKTHLSPMCGITLNFWHFV